MSTISAENIAQSVGFAAVLLTVFGLSAYGLSRLYHFSLEERQLPWLARLYMIIAAVTTVGLLLSGLKLATTDYLRGLELAIWLVTFPVVFILYVVRPEPLSVAYMLLVPYRVIIPVGFFLSGAVLTVLMLLDTVKH